MANSIPYGDLISGPDDHAGRPSAADVGPGALFVCTDDDVVERSDGSTWVEWFDPEEPQ